MAGNVRFTNEKGYDLSVAIWLADDEYDHAPVEGKYISATGLLKPLRMIVLEQRVRAQIAQSGTTEVVDLDRFIASRMGSAIHSAIEHSWTRNLKKSIMGDNTPAFYLALQRLGYKPDMIRRVVVNPTEEQLDERPDIIPIYMEKREFKKIGDWTVGGQFDFIGNGSLEDFKSMAVYGYLKGDKDEEQLLQGSIYRWLNPELVTNPVMKIQHIFTDWSKLESMKNKNYPQKRLLSKELRLKDPAEMQMWIHKKLNQVDDLLNVPESNLPRCTPAELWQADPVYKYYKNPDAKKSTKNFDNYHEAATRKMKDGDVGIVKEFFGKVKRCGYCSAYDICTQKDEYIAEGILQMP